MKKMALTTIPSFFFSIMPSLFLEVFSSEIMLVEASIHIPIDDYKIMISSPKLLDLE